MFFLAATIFKYIFIFVIYFFVYQVIRLMVSDIKSQNNEPERGAYLKLINRREALPFSINEHYSLSSLPFSIGRESSNTMVINDSYVSKKHCEITNKEKVFFLRDLNSANGTFYNGERLKDAVKLKDGDKIGVGEARFLFVSGEER